MRHRAIGAIEGIRKTNGNHLVVSHGDVIRVILNHYLGAHIDEFQRLSVDPASISVIRFTNGNVSVQRINSTTDFGAHSGSTLGGGAGSK
jgi:broad specificity phosphatase PhoE